MITGLLRPLRKLLREAQRVVSIRSGAFPHLPETVYLEPSRTCNLRCLYCARWSEPAPRETLRHEDWIRILRELADWAGSCHVNLASGEPLLHPGTLPLAEEARRLGHRVTVVTNGTLLTRENAAALRRADVDTVVVSLDGLRPETHDRGRGMEGTHARVMAGLESLHAAGLPSRTEWAVLVAGHNLDELAGLTRFARAKGLRGVRFQVLWPGSPGWKEFWPMDRQRLDETLSSLAALGRGAGVLNPPGQLRAMRAYYACPEAPCDGDGCRSDSTLVIGPDGAVRTCRRMEPVGDAHRHSLRDIWRSRHCRERLHEVTSCRRSCALLNCNYRPRLTEKIGAWLAERVRL
jgi:hypothetical protein